MDFFCVNVLSLTAMVRIFNVDWRNATNVTTENENIGIFWHPFSFTPLFAIPFVDVETRTQDQSVANGTQPNLLIIGPKQVHG